MKGKPESEPYTFNTTESRQSLSGLEALTPLSSPSHDYPSDDHTPDRLSSDCHSSEIPPAADQPTAERRRRSTKVIIHGMLAWMCVVAIAISHRFGLPTCNNGLVRIASAYITVLVIMVVHVGLKMMEEDGRHPVIVREITEVVEILITVCVVAIDGFDVFQLPGMAFGCDERGLRRLCPEGHVVGVACPGHPSRPGQL